MNTFKARGIVIKEVIVGDNDKCLTILLKDLGKFNVWSRNCRKNKSKLLAGSSLFTYADFIIFDNGKTLSLNQIDIIESFYTLTENLDALAYGTYFLEFVDKNISEATPVNNIMLLLLKSLVILSKDTPIPQKLVSKIFEIKFLQISGYIPLIENCNSCNKIFDKKDSIFFNVNGVFCSNCKTSDSSYIKINYNTLYTIRYILSSNLDNIYKFKTSREVLENLSLVNKKLLNEHIYTNLKSKEFIEQIEIIKSF